MPSQTDDFQSAQEKEYGTYVAVAPISIDGVRAFNTGDPVPASHVDNGVVAKESVARRDTKAGKAAIGEEA